MKNRFPREFYIPKGAIKIADKQSSAVAYIYTVQGNPCAVAFHGKADKPDWRFRFASDAKREKHIAAHFQQIQGWERGRTERAGQRKAFQHSFKVGDVFKTCWGYDQTNVEFFECTAVIGKMIEVREINTESVEDGGMAFSGRCVPMLGNYKGEPLRRLARERGIRIDEVRWASPAEHKTVAGAKVFQPASFSWGH